MAAIAFKLVQRITDELTEQIISGALAPGTLLPSADELKSAYGLDVTQAAWVRRQLRKRRLVRAIRGWGLVVGAPAEESLWPWHSASEDRISEITGILSGRVRAGQIATHERVVTQKQLRVDFQVSDEIATGIKHRLEHQGWAYSIPYRGLFAAPCDDWPADPREPNHLELMHSKETQHVLPR